MLLQGREEGAAAVETVAEEGWKAVGGGGPPKERGAEGLAWDEEGGSDASKTGTAGKGPVVPDTVRDVGGEG